ncbi:MAG TPA: TonB-dependent receptor [Chlorobaculum sp.]|nr:TonB-dependent receptor [Chlorobaculum sp.]
MTVQPSIALPATTLGQEAIAVSSGSLTGQIVDQSDGLALPGVSVIVKGTSKVGVTDQYGRFRIDNIRSGSVVISISYIGYVNEEHPVSLNPLRPTILNISLKPGLVIGKEVVVVGEQLKGQAKALNQKIKSGNIVDVISADQIGKFPDSNAGDALKRVPGISVFNDQGEARFIQIRGTEPRFNSVMINGERIPSAEAAARNVQLDLVPADMLQTIEVNKTLTPDMEADAIGGAVNLITMVPGSRRISVTAAAGQNLIDQTGGLRTQFEGVYGNRFLDGKLGVLVAGSYYDTNFGSDDIEAEWTRNNAGKTLLKQMQVRTYDIERLRRSFSTNLDYRVNENHILKFSGIYNWRNDWEKRFRTTYTGLVNDAGDYNSTGEIRMQDKGGTNKSARLEDQRMMSFSLGGEHHFDKLEVDWKAAYSKSSQEKPHQRYIEINEKKQPFTVDVSDPGNPLVTMDASSGISSAGTWGLKTLTDQSEKTKDEDKNYALDFKYELDRNLKLKFGGKFRNKDKEMESEFYSYTPVNKVAFMNKVYSNLINPSKKHFLPGDQYVIGSYVDPDFLGSLNLDNAGEFTKSTVLSELAGDYRAKENVRAAYGMLTWDATDKLCLIGGLRVEHTSNEYDAYVYDDTADTLTPVHGDKRDYTNVLPHVSLRYKLDQFTNIRLAYTQSLARPDYFDLAPYRQILAEDEEIYIGNPGLKPTLSKNFDFMIDRYLGSVSMVSIGYFHKSISNFIVHQRSIDSVTGYDLFQPVNGGDGNINGIEAAAQFQIPYLKGLGLYLNYTYTDSKIKHFNIKGREDDDLPLPGSPAHTFNASVSYETGPLSLRLSGNYHSAFMDSEEGSIGENKWQDRYYDSSFTMDFNGTYKLTKELHLFFEINNLTNQPMRFYQGEKRYVAQEEWYDRRFMIGMKADF